MIQVSFSLIWNVLSRVFVSVAAAPTPVRPLPHPIELRPGMGWPPPIPNDAFALPMLAQSNVSLTMVIWLKPVSYTHLTLPTNREV